MPSLTVTVLAEDQLSVSWAAAAGANTYSIQISNYSGDVAALQSVDGSILTATFASNIRKYVVIRSRNQSTVDMGPVPVQISGLIQFEWSAVEFLLRI